MICPGFQRNGGGMGAKTGRYCVGDTGQGSWVFVDQTLIHPKVTEVARCLVAQYNAGLTNYGNSGVLEAVGTEAGNKDGGVTEARAVLTPDRVEKRQNGRRMKEAGETMFTLTAQDQHGVYLPDEVSGDAGLALSVRNATKQGCDMARPETVLCRHIRKAIPGGVVLERAVRRRWIRGA